MFIFAGVCTLIMFATLPETYAPVILLKKVKKMRKTDPEGSKDMFAEHENQDWSFKGLVHRTLFRPFKMLSMEPILILITAYLSVVYGLLYACACFPFPPHIARFLTPPPAVFQAFPIVFIERRGFTIGQDGLIFIGVGIGTTLGSAINLWTTAHYPALIAKWKGFPPPEQRLFGAMLGSPLLVVGIFWLGWTGQYSSVPWYVPGLSTIVIGTAISLIFMSFLVRRPVLAFRGMELTVGTELSCRHVFDVQRVRVRCEHRRTLLCGGGVPSVHGPDVHKCTYSLCFP